jgi:aminoglycoside phosphotransferase (APT) family kinase protein
VHSRTKQEVSGEELSAAVSEAFGQGTAILSARELTDGMFNAAWLLELDHVGVVVLKVAPPPDMPLLTYEHHIMRTEALFLQLAATTASVPALHHAGFDRTCIGRDFLVTSALQGTSWHRARGRLSSPVRRRLRHELGQMVAGLHQIHGPTFGYPQPETGLNGNRWAEVFLTMLDAVLADAERFGVPLPVSPADIRALATAQIQALDEVTTPTLVHFDLWEGNIMLDTGASGPRIEGLIDAERAFWGDPHADFVSLALFGDIKKDDAFLAGYRTAGGQVDFTPRLRRRLTLYQAYLYLIMIVEAVPRGYAGPRHLVTQGFCRHKLKDALCALSGATEAGR